MRVLMIALVASVITSSAFACGGNPPPAPTAKQVAAAKKQPAPKHAAQKAGQVGQPIGQIRCNADDLLN